MKRTLPTGLLLLPLLAVAFLLPAAESAADRELAEYFRAETARLAAGSLAHIRTREDWEKERVVARQQLQEMLGLSPWPERTDLKATVTGRVEHDEFYVENLHYQSVPGLYVGANLYVPKQRAGKVPAILYVCGHGQVKTNGVSYGNKVAYQHHGAWFARHGYVCLTIDTIQLGELEGIHHGTYREGMWWWNARGYTPAGVEAWNAIRGLDYLQSRPEVDGAKLGVTGRSGGGGYSWWTAALDERIQAAVPVAGITDLQNHVVDGCVEGHCDCMFMLNTYRWDYAKVAALVAPRPLLISNTDKDRIFPLDGVVRLHREVARIYALYGRTNECGLLITEGPHKDTQDLQVPAFRWFNRHLQGEEPLVRTPAEKFFTGQQLKVFSSPPADERTTRIHETFVAAARPPVPANPAAWEAQRNGWLQALREKAFRGWPDTVPAPALTSAGVTRYPGFTLGRWSFLSQAAVTLPLFVLTPDPAGAADQPVTVRVLDETEVATWLPVLAGSVTGPAAEQPLKSLLPAGGGPVALFWPRGLGPTAWSGDARKQVQIKRRFMLLGQTLEGMRVWDIHRAVRAAQLAAGRPAAALHGAGGQGVNALYAALFTDGITGVRLLRPSASHAAGPDYLNVLRFLDVPQAVALAVERYPVMLATDRTADWSWALETARQLGWPTERLQVTGLPASP